MSAAKSATKSAAKSATKNSIFNRIRLADSDTCPCGLNGKTYGECCGPLHHGERRASTALELMASRYSAYAAHEADYIWQTWHPRNRPELINFDDSIEWIGLEIVEVIDGGSENPDDREGIVEFRAHYLEPAPVPGKNKKRPAVMAERSRFIKRGKRWVYLDGEIF